jgi:hypothetical protein
MTAAPMGERAAPESRFPHEMRNAATAYASSASTDVAAYEGLPGHHLLAIRNLIATTNDESYHGSASELPPATSHGYTEWDFSGVLDPVMFQRFLDAADYGSVVPTTPASGDTTPHVSASWWSSTTRPTARTWRGLVTEKPPRTRGPAYPRTRGQAHPHIAGKRHRHQCAAGSSTRARG